MGRWVHVLQGKHRVAPHASEDPTSKTSQLSNSHPSKPKQPDNAPPTGAGHVESLIQSHLAKGNTSVLPTSRSPGRVSKPLSSRKSNPLSPSASPVTSAASHGLAPAGGSQTLVIRAVSKSPVSSETDGSPPKPSPPPPVEEHSPSTRPAVPRRDLVIHLTRPAITR